jgi:hypothetical protein
MVQAHFPDHNIFGYAVWGGLSWVRSEVSQREEGAPEASFGCIVAQGRGDGGEGEACGALRPGEPDAWLCVEERLLNQGVVDSVDIAGGARAYGHEDLGLCGQYLPGEQAGRLVGHVGFGQSDGVEAPLQGFQGAGADGLLEHEHDA